LYEFDVNLFYFIKHIITNNNKILYKLFYTLFPPYKKSWKKYPYPRLNCIQTLYLLFEKIYNKFEVYPLNLYKFNAKTRIWICITDSIFYLFTIEEKILKSWYPNMYPFASLISANHSPSLTGTRIISISISSQNHIHVNRSPCLSSKCQDNPNFPFPHAPKLHSYEGRVWHGSRTELQRRASKSLSNTLAPELQT
jgi:hypothetical protein